MAHNRVRYHKITDEEEDEEGEDDDSAALTFSGDPEDAKTLTVAEAVEHIGMGLFQVKIMLLYGFACFCEAFEMMLIAILAPALKCEWLLSDVQIAFITTIVFVGWLTMSPLWGGLADHYGRRHVSIAVHLWIGYYGYITAFSPTFFWVLLFRGFVGAGLAGDAHGFVLVSEYLPVKWRGRVLSFIIKFGTLGEMTEIAIAAAIMLNVPPDASIPGWRILVFVSAIPLTFSLLAVNFLPESARFLVAAGRRQEALEILNEGARLNKQPQIQWNLKPEVSVVRGNFRDLFKGNLTRITIGSWILWFTAGFIFYGALLLSAIILEINKKTCATDEDARLELEAGGSPASPSAVCSCTPMSPDAYYTMFVSTLGEIAAALINIFTLDKFGRKNAIVGYLIIEAIFIFLLIPCYTDVHIVTVLIFGVRAMSSALFNAVYIYAAEVYPTKVRSLGLGSSSAAARIGCIVTPFVAQVLIDHNRTAALIVYGSIAISVSLVALLLVEETKGRLQVN